MHALQYQSFSAENSCDMQAKVENVITHLSIIQNVNIIQKARLKDKRRESEVRPFGNN